MSYQGLVVDGPVKERWVCLDNPIFKWHVSYAKSSRAKQEEKLTMMKEFLDWDPSNA